MSAESATTQTQIFALSPPLLDSALYAQNLVKKIVRSTKKSFCYFLLLQKVESPLPYRLQTTKRRNHPLYIFLCGFCGFVESNAESTNLQNLTRKKTQNSPLILQNHKNPPRRFYDSPQIPQRKILKKFLLCFLPLNPNKPAIPQFRRISRKIL